MKPHQLTSRTSLAIGLLMMCLTAPTATVAGGANTKTGIGKGNGTSCPAGFHYDEDAGKCVAANWI